MWSSVLGSFFGAVFGFVVAQLAFIVLARMNNLSGKCE